MVNQPAKRSVKGDNAPKGILQEPKHTAPYAAYVAILADPRCSLFGRLSGILKPQKVIQIVLGPASYARLKGALQHTCGVAIKKLDRRRLVYPRACQRFDSLFRAKR